MCHGSIQHCLKLFHARCDAEAKGDELSCSHGSIDCLLELFHARCDAEAEEDELSCGMAAYSAGCGLISISVGR